jgi:hypothetical protein
MNLREDLRRALERAGDAEERAALAEAEVKRLRGLVADSLTREAEDAGLYPKVPGSDIDEAREARDAAVERERHLTAHLRHFVKRFDATDGFDPRHCQPSVDKDYTLNRLRLILKGTP